MRAIRVASAALLGVTALTCFAPAAVAGDDDNHYVMSNGYRVLPSTVAAGGEVVLQVDRVTSGCRSSVTVTSGVFDAVVIRKGSASAVAQVDRDAEPGASYRVTFSCGGVSAVKELTIAAVRPDPVRPQPPRGVHAGEGGSSAGFDLKEIGLGTALIAGSVGAAYRVARRRAGEDGG
ncbi:hypothetical protein PYK79_43620 [Streptomyces sp. ID05-04B]|uniref:hypothetical protein n=1 Tax=unclassified Streptomyces TaxID=2593676 RepID=UPI000D19FF97|nr:MULTISPECIES: hypothetical protein [unclassified Streptomyces]AVV44014.1 hypothetical protein C6376_23755 [Streptomyces sp. P3]MDX5568827.1 hypothetical protein [Streptomyces sp. ID05-04B]